VLVVVLLVLVVVLLVLVVVLLVLVVVLLHVFSATTEVLVLVRPFYLYIDL
jgi:hypothetical protein